MTHLLLATIPVFSQLESVMRHVLNFFHASLGLPWAWSIIATTVAVRMLLVPLTIKQIHSMQSLQLHAPEMKRIQQKYKHDKQKQNEELMKFYRENKINPAASCLPMLAQAPVFIALYYTLKSATFTGDLSFLHFVPSIAERPTSFWGGYVLLGIYVLSQLFSSYFMSTTAQPGQRVMLMILPLFIVGFIYRFPSGLTLYWVTTNLWTVGQGLITRRLVQKTPAPALEKRSSRAAPKEDDDGTAGNGASPEPTAPKPAPAANAQPRQVRRKKSTGGRRR